MEKKTSCQKKTKKPALPEYEPIEDKSDLDRYSYSKLISAIFNKLWKSICG